MFVVDCPICGEVLQVGRREEAPYRPFCSQRCKLVDLGRWLDGTYRVSEPLSPDVFSEDDSNPLNDDPDVPSR